MGTLEKAADRMKGFVFAHMGVQETAGNLSKAHAYDHVGNVARYAGRLAPFFAERFETDGPEALGHFAEMVGYAHDVVRYASQVDAGEEESARLLAESYPNLFSDVVGYDDFRRLVVDVVRHSDLSFPEMRDHYRDDPQARAVALAVTTGDKLMEASGPRVLERRSFFVGRERMRKEGDLGAVFSFPEESPHGVLTETMVRLGSVNHPTNYGEFPELSDLAQELHAPQYHWYRGLLLHLGMDDEEAHTYLVGRLRENDATQKLATRLEEGGKRLIDEHHLTGDYFTGEGFSALADAVRNPPEDDDVKESSAFLVQTFAQAERPEQPIERFKAEPSGPPTFRDWMGDIIAYRNGDYWERLIEKLGAR